MIGILLIVFFLVFVAALLEERMESQRLYALVFIGVVLVLCAGLKEVGFDNDSENYDYAFSHPDDPYLLITMEYSFLLISQLVGALTSDVHVMFFLYAGVGITLKLLAIRRLSELWFLPILVYLGNYFLIHDLTQIRACVVSGLLLLAIKPWAEGRKGQAALLLLVGSLFHYSTLVLFPALFLGNGEMSKRERIAWAMVVPLGYLIYFSHINPLTTISIPYIGEKLEIYQDLNEKGIMGDQINVFNAVFLTTWAAYLYILLFYDSIKEHNKYLPLMIKLTGISIFSFIALSFLPVLAFRVSELFGIVEIVLISTIAYTIKPTMLGRAIVALYGLAVFCINVFYNEIFTF